MSPRARKKYLQNYRMNVKISFFQDAFTIIEELSGDSPNTGLPEGFRVGRGYYTLFRKLQKKYKITDLCLTNFDEIKNLQEWKSIRYLINSYKNFWNRKKYKLLDAKQYLLKKVELNKFIKKLENLTKIAWTTKVLNLFITIGYKRAGTYDRKRNIIRIGVHEGKKKYLLYTLYHELIHLHIVKHMNLKLSEKEEEILCRAIFNMLFKNNKIAQNHWKEFLNKKEIERINKKVLELQRL